MQMASFCIEKLTGFCWDYQVRTKVEFEKEHNVHTLIMCNQKTIEKISTLIRKNKNSQKKVAHASPHSESFVAASLPKHFSQLGKDICSWLYQPIGMLGDMLRESEDL
jgi:hypothetical protein